MTQLSPKFPNFAIQILLFRSKHTVAVVTHAHVLQNFYTTWVRGVACQKQRLGPKLEGAGLGEHPKIWDPLRKLFLQPLKLANSNLVGLHNLGLGLAYQKSTFRTKIGGGLGYGSIKNKFGTPYLFLQPLNLATSNLVHNLGLGLAYQKQRFGPKLAEVWARGASTKCGTPTYFCNR